MRPPVTTRPRVGCMMPATIWSSVLLPDPFGPTSAKTSPGSTVRWTFLSAQKGCARRQAVEVFVLYRLWKST